MKKLIVLICSLLFLIGGCASVRTMMGDGNQRTADSLREEQLAIMSKLEKAIQDRQLLEGMTAEMVERSWGQPLTKISSRNGFSVWKYADTELYFACDILFNWSKNKP